MPQGVLLLKAIKSAEEDRNMVVVVFIDLDNFKNVTVLYILDVIFYRFYCCFSKINNYFIFLYIPC